MKESKAHVSHEQSPPIVNLVINSEQFSVEGEGLSLML